jgi:integrase
MQERLIHRPNYLLVKEFLKYWSGKVGNPDSTITRYWFYLRHVLLWAMDIPFNKAHNISEPLSKYISRQANQKGEPVSSSTQKKVIETARIFFEWAKKYHEKQFRSLPAFWVDDLRPSPRLVYVPSIEYISLDEVLRITAFPEDLSDLALIRDIAASASLFMSAQRACAFVTTPIKAVHLDVKDPCINQWPELGVKTKGNVKATTFLNVIPELMEVALRWDCLLHEKIAQGVITEDTPWFAPVDHFWGEQFFSTKEPGANRAHALGRRLGKLHELVGIPHKSPHKYRHGYAVYSLSRCKTMQEYHAFSRNMMHASIATTDKIYVHMEEQERARVLRGLSATPVLQGDDDLEQLLNKIDPADRMRAIHILSGRMG